MLITREEIIDIGWIRGINPESILDYHVNVAEEIWVKSEWSKEFWKSVNDDLGSFSEWILDYVAPVIALGTLMSNFQALTQPLYEGGLGQGEFQGANLEMRREFQSEVWKNLKVMQKRMHDSAMELRDSGDTRFQNYGEPKEDKRFWGNEKTIGAPR
jgi:hypothetical protein